LRERIAAVNRWLRFFAIRSHQEPLEHQQENSIGSVWWPVGPRRRAATQSLRNQHLFHPRSRSNNALNLRFVGALCGGNPGTA